MAAAAGRQLHRREAAPRTVYIPRCPRAPGLPRLPGSGAAAGNLLDRARAPITLRPRTPPRAAPGPAGAPARGRPWAVPSAATARARAAMSHLHFFPLLTAAEIADSPSRRDGVSAATEEGTLRKCARVIYHAAEFKPYPNL